jgi:hypothetical protein
MQGGSSTHTVERSVETVMQNTHESVIREVGSQAAAPVYTPQGSSAPSGSVVHQNVTHIHNDSTVTHNNNSSVTNNTNNTSTTRNTESGSDRRNRSFLDTLRGGSHE